MVVKSIPPNSVAVGTPAVVVTTYDEYMNRMKRKVKSSIVVKHIPNELNYMEKEKLRNDWDTIGFIL